MKMLIPHQSTWRQVDIGKRTFNGRLGRAGKWLFEKLSNQVEVTTTTRGVIGINTGSIVEAIRKCQYACGMVWDKELAFVVIGPDAFEELHDEYNQRMNNVGPMNFNVQMQIGIGREIRVFSVPVRFVPWATGVLCVPK